MGNGILASFINVGLAAGFISAISMHAAGLPGQPPEVEGCDDDAYAKVKTVPDPESSKEGVVVPVGSGGEALYLVVLTLPNGSCLPYRFRQGGVVIFVQEGMVKYTAHFTNDEPVVRKGKSNGSETDIVEIKPDNLAVDPDKEVTLGKNEWITQDRGIWYTLVNDSGAEAVVSVASYADPPWDDDPCSGGCRKP